MRALKSVALAGLVATSLTLIPVKPAAALSVYHSPNPYEEFIYSHESSNIVARKNPYGCIGLGQSCPYPFGSNNTPELALYCPDWATNLDCQLHYWREVYMPHRYGTWYGSYLFWARHFWW